MIKFRTLLGFEWIVDTLSVDGDRRIVDKGRSQGTGLLVTLNKTLKRKTLVKTKYARILLFQFVFTKYVFRFRNYDGLIFVVIFQNVIMRKYDKIRF